MRRLALLFAVAALVAACDSAAPGDDLAGTWTLTGVDVDLRVTSQTTQTIPDLTAAPSGAVTVSGAVSSDLRYLGYASRAAADGGISMNLVSENPLLASPTSTELWVFQSSGGASVQVRDGRSDRFFYGDVSGAVVTQDGARLSVAPSSVSDYDGSVTVRGSLAFPAVVLTANQPTVIPQPSAEGMEGVTTFEFQPGGRLILTTTFEGGSESTVGAWEVVGDGQVRIRDSGSSTAPSITFGYAVNGQSLRLDASALAAGVCPESCLRDLEGSLLAGPGSLTAASTSTVFEFRRSGGASARVAPSQGPARPSAVRFAPTVPFLGHRP